MTRPQTDLSQTAPQTSAGGLLDYLLKDRERIARFLIVALCLFGMMAGRSDLSRVAVLSAVMPGVEIRLLCLIAMAMLAALWRLDSRAVPFRQIGIWPLIAAAPWLAMLVYGVVGSYLLWPAADYRLYLADFVYIIVYVVTLAVVVRNRDDLALAAIFLQIFSLLVFVVSLLRLGPDSHAYNYGEIVTTTTMYRIYGAGFCSALYLLFSRPGQLAKLTQFALAIVLTFAMLSSTSKTSVVAIFAIIAIIAVFASIFARWKELLVLLIVVASGVLLFLNVGQSHLLTDRLANFGGDSFSETAIAPTPALPGAGAAVNPAVTPCNPDAVAQLADNVALRPYSCVAQVVVPDPSERLRMLSYALELFGQNPTFGVGPNGYNLGLGGEGDINVYPYAHNILADALAKTGIVGTSLLLLAFWGLLVVCVRAAARQFESIYMTSIPLLYLAGSMTGGDLYDTRVGWAIAAAVGGAYGWRALSSSRIG